MDRNGDTHTHADRKDTGDTEDLASVVYLPDADSTRSTYIVGRELLKSEAELNQQGHRASLILNSERVGLTKKLYLSHRIADSQHCRPYRIDLSATAGGQHVIPTSTSLSSFC